jgi:hypothetical protein
MIARDSIASASTISGACALCSVTAMPTTWKLWTITEVRRWPSVTFHRFILARFC